MLWVDEIAITPTLTLSIGILPTFGLSEVGDRAVFYLDWRLIVVFTGHSPNRCLCLLFTCILDVKISDHVLADVVGDDHVEDFAELAELEEDFFKEILKMMRGLHQFILGSLDSFRKSNCSTWVWIKVREKHGLRKLWFIMLSCTAVAVAAGAYLVVERAVDFIVLCTKLFS